ncbi:MAG: Crp/Fnr family transcriptional regulator [Acidobacteria bacterium]|nr:Crp/Fnr family transcriptional regulator [Acidobacteriota bacterium]
MDDSVPFQPILCGSGASPRLTALQKAEVLRRAEILSQATVEELLRLAAVAKELQVSAGEVVFQEGDLSDALYVVIEGRVELTRGPAPVVEVATPGQAFGTYAVLTREPRYFTAKAVEDTFTLAIAADDFYDLLSHNAEMLEHVFRWLVRKIV